ncbi:MAG TPA: DUF4215 domain-containing protein, partial [Polyangiaceae bacterium]|nr:DUF4215 domain-containing protein [Polyangiaceae bacterium]
MALASILGLVACASSGPATGPLGGGSGTTIPGAGGGTPGAGGGTGLVGTTGGGGVSLVVTATCGNGVQDPGELCDDLNTLAGDGCSALCQIEAEWECPVFGQPCAFKPVCGDGILSSTEACDDLNTLPGDGCAADCLAVDPGWLCRVPGRPCIPWCGDGVLTFPETCEDANTVAGDGCSPTCLTEPGWDCSSGTCIQSICGNGVQELGESCDRGADNGLFYGDPANPGCSKTCTLEPSCRTGGVTGACQTFCGDGNIDLGEVCDDGNMNPGDGCDTACQPEGGFTCETIVEPDTEPCSSGGGECLMLPVI